MSDEPAPSPLTARVTARLTDAVFDAVLGDEIAWGVGREFTLKLYQRIRAAILAAIAPDLQDAEAEIQRLSDLQLTADEIEIRRIADEPITDEEMAHAETLREKMRQTVKDYDAVKTLERLQDAERRLREAEARAGRFKEALVVIAEGRGPFSTDRYEHACNVIASMKEVATDALEEAAAALADPQAQGRETP
jgi:hypothetical protein